MRIIFAVFMLSGLICFLSCNKERGSTPDDISDQIKIDSLSASSYSVRAWDTTTITCYVTGVDLIYGWECDHGNFNGSGDQIKYGAGECCVGINTITCTVSNFSGEVSQEIQIEVTSYFGGK